MKEKIRKASTFLKDKFGKAPPTAIILGSGLSQFCDELNSKQTLPYKEIPGALPSSVEGHRGELLKGEFHGQELIVLAGRLHGYEGHSPEQVVFLPRALRVWGVNTFILTNASGATHKDFMAGDLVLIKDHINFTGKNPLKGLELFDGDRFPDMSDPYSKKWRGAVLAKRPHLKEGVYAGVLGPSFETAAEVEMLRRWGVDLVGMSTVWETIALVQLKAKVLGLSCVANLGTGVKDTPLTHEEVLESTQSAYAQFRTEISYLLETRPL